MRDSSTTHKIPKITSAQAIISSQNGRVAFHLLWQLLIKKRERSSQPEKFELAVAAAKPRLHLRLQSQGESNLSLNSFCAQEHQKLLCRHAWPCLQGKHKLDPIPQFPSRLNLSGTSHFLSPWLYRQSLPNSQVMATVQILGQGSGDFWAQPAKIRPFTTSSGFLQDLTGCKLVAIHLDRPISYIFVQVPANFVFIVMTTGQELGHW